MAVKTFTSGEVLTSSDTNTYLANSGLVYVTGTTGTATAAINVNDCFSATYDNYRIVISNVTADATRSMYLRLRVSGTDSAANYYWGARYSLFAAGSADVNGNNVSYFLAGTVSTAPKSGGSFDVMNPFDTVHTTFMGTAANFDAAWWIGGVHQVNTSYTGFSLLPVAGTLTATVRVYGYREA